MNWDALQTEAKQKGYLIFAMDQSQTPVMTQPGPWGAAYSGFCAGLAIRWIALRYVGQDYRYDSKTLECDMPDWQATRDQTLYEIDLAKDGADFPKEYKPTFGVYGLFLNDGLVTRMATAVTGAILRQAGAGKELCYFIEMKRAGGGHAIAMENIGRAGWRLFDANYGEFKCKDAASFETFMTWYLYKTGYGTRYNTAINIVGVNQPPYTAANFQDLIKKQEKLLGR